MSSDHISVAADLEALLSGALDSSDFRSKYKRSSDSEVLNAIWDNLHHYLDDADIRERDESYRDMQENELRKLIRMLREDAPVAHLRRISFLTVT
jgi:tRNA A37 N6-isopentenylltransferase MiaA